MARPTADERADARERDECDERRVHGGGTAAARARQGVNRCDRLVDLLRAAVEHLEPEDEREDAGDDTSGVVPL
jgi:hypothetical protein